MRATGWAMLMVIFVGCESLFFSENVPQDPRSTFNYLWKEVDEKYSFFDYKGINWNEVYNRYEPLVFQSMSDDSLFTVLGAMLNELRDDHSNLISYFNISRYDVAARNPDIYDFRLVRDNYIGLDFYITGGFAHDLIKNHNIGYVQYGSFQSQVDKNDLDFVLDKYKKTDGLILDLRENGGGNPANIYRILERFASQKTLLYRSRIKNGPRHNDFGALRDVYVDPYGGLPVYRKPVAVLIDRGSYSAGSFFALAARSMPGMFLVGDSTGGGLGLPNGGQLPNGWTYRFSVSQTFDPAGNNFENGVPPDFRVLLDEEDKKNGIDTVIEKALEELGK